MFGKWAWGFWQCKNHYKTQKQILSVFARYRKNHIPIDNIIQDWQYWQTGQWGSHKFDPSRYPNPGAMVQKIHDEHGHIIVSVWPKFDLGTKHVKQLERVDGVFHKVFKSVWPKGQQMWYDPFNPKARKVYWKQIRNTLFADGFDGWWLDASEPELTGHWGELRDLQTPDGPGAKVFNAYPLLHTTAVYQGQRRTTSKQRVFILTRSAYAGQQRNAAVTWSGDIQGNWKTFAKQIPAGLNFAASGIPYWNTDIGGFFDHKASDPKYARLFTRWFQFGAFCPMFRVHGNHFKEMWQFDKHTESILIKYDKLRYHLIPYIYSVAWRVTHHGYTMMRPLVMDFRHDAKVYDIKNQFMFGPDIMVCPVTRDDATSRSVYLPQGTDWINFWTGQRDAGGQSISTPAPLQTLPLFFHAGSILPYGPSVQYAMQKTGPITLRIYPGADGRFTLYDDKGTGYAYEKGAYATVPIRWNNREHQLTIGKRHGRYGGMRTHRTFRIVVVKPGRGTAVSLATNPDTTVQYDGNPVTVTLH